MVEVQVQIIKGFAYAVVENGDFSEHIKIKGTASFSTELGCAVIRALQIDSKQYSEVLRYGHDQTV